MEGEEEEEEEEKKKKKKKTKKKKKKKKKVPSYRYAISEAVSFALSRRTELKK